MTHDTHPRFISFLMIPSSKFARLYMLQDPACVEQTQGTRDCDKMFQIGVSAGILTKSFYIHAFITQSSPKKQLFSCFFVCLFVFVFVLFCFSLVCWCVQSNYLELFCIPSVSYRSLVRPVQVEIQIVEVRGDRTLDLLGTQPRRKTTPWKISSDVLVMEKQGEASPNHLSYLQY